MPDLPVMRLLAVTRDLDSSSFIQRVIHYIPPLANLGIEIAVERYPKPLAEQWRFLGRLNQYDGVWWHRYMPTPFMLRRLRRYARVLAYDFDDALCFSSKDGGRPSFSRRWRFRGILGACDLALPASRYLADLAAPHCRRWTVVPMAISPAVTDMTVPPRPSPPLRLLWMGSASTEPYLDLIRPVLEELGRRRRDVELRLVAHTPRTFGALTVDFRRWSVEQEALALAQCHIGLCPMPDTPWTRGKCPYKVLQYMAWAMPWVGSAVGENLLMVERNGRHSTAPGLYAADAQQWHAALDHLLDDVDRRQAMGRAGLRRVAEEHDRMRLAETLARLWRDMVPGHAVKS